MRPGPVAGPVNFGHSRAAPDVLPDPVTRWASGSRPGAGALITMNPLTPPDLAAKNKPYAQGS